MDEIGKVLAPFILLYFLGGILWFLIKEIFHHRTSNRKAKETHQRWLDEIEPALRHAKGYPEDWEIRRNEIYKQAHGICINCGKLLGPPHNIHQSKGSHIHHKKPISQGGNHSLSNLELLCEDCHASKHPSNELLASKTSNAKQLSNGKHLYAVKQMTCSQCNASIPHGDTYYGTKNNSIFCWNCIPPKGSSKNLH